MAHIPAAKSANLSCFSMDAFVFPTHTPPKIWLVVAAQTITAPIVIPPTLAETLFSVIIISLDLQPTERNKYSPYPLIIAFPLIVTLVFFK